MAKRITIHDVAKRAGVSPMTVSRALSDSTSVKSETRKRVETAAAALGYRPSVSARSLRSSRSHWLVLLYQRPLHGEHRPMVGYIAELQYGILQCCQHTGYSLSLQPCTTSEPQLARDIEQMCAQFRPDGVLLHPPLSSSRPLLAALQREAIPVVRIGSVSFTDTSPCVETDDRKAAKEMTEYLIAQGHRKIGFIKGPVEHPASALRFQGFRDALRAARLTLPEGYVQAGLFTVNSGIQAARTLLSMRTRPTAIFASNDEMAAGCLSAAHEAGILVPSQLSIVGFDDTYLASMVWPALTTIHQPIRDIGDAAAKQLIALIRSRATNPLVTMSHRLIVRDSVTAPST